MMRVQQTVPYGIYQNINTTGKKMYTPPIICVMGKTIQSSMNVNEVVNSRTVRNV